MPALEETHWRWQQEKEIKCSGLADQGNWFSAWPILVLSVSLASLMGLVKVMAVWVLPYPVWLLLFNEHMTQECWEGWDQRKLEREAGGSGVKGAPWPCSLLRPGKDTWMPSQEKSKKNIKMFFKTWSILCASEMTFNFPFATLAYLVGKNQSVLLEKTLRERRRVMDIHLFYLVVVCVDHV